MAPSTEQAAARVPGSDSASCACWSASWSRPSWTRAAALWRAACAWAPKLEAGGRTLHRATTARRDKPPRPDPLFTAFALVGGIPSTPFLNPFGILPWGRAEVCRRLRFLRLLLGPPSVRDDACTLPEGDE